jgi:hypothetical protein
MNASATIPFTTTAPGDFTLPHNLGIVPSTVIVEYTSGGAIWFQSPRFDSENLYLVASGSRVTGFVIVYASCGNC